MMNHLFDRIKLPFRKDRELYSCLYNILGFYPRKLGIYRIALAHKSQAYRNEQGRPLNNERLEFLGDAVLESVVSDIVYRYFGQKREGFLTTTRSKIVQRETLNKVALEMGLDRLIQSDINSTSHNSNLMGNAFEALVGAIYLDRGYSYCFRFFSRRVLGRHIDLKNMANREVNFKSKLIEWCQKNRIKVEFPLESETMGEGNTPLFHSEVLLENIRVGHGEGYSKKESQQNAAKEAFARVRRNEKLAQRVTTARDLRLRKENAGKDTTSAKTSTASRQPATASGKAETAAKTATTAKRRATASKQVVRPAEATTTAPEQVTRPVEATTTTPEQVVRPAEATTAATEDVATAAAPTTERPKRRRTRRKTEKPATTETAKAAEDEAPAAPKTADAPKAENKPRRRRPAKAAEKKPEEIDREAIIRAAEEAAFREHAEEAN